MFKHILIPVVPGQADEYDTALDAAQRLLEPGGKVSVLSVVEEIPTYAGAYVPTTFTEQHIAETSKGIDARFSEVAECHVCTGHASNTILSWAETHGAEAIVIRSHRPGFSDFFLGSTASRVVRHATCAVLVLR